MLVWECWVMSKQGVEKYLMNPKLFTNDLKKKKKLIRNMGRTRPDLYHEKLLRDSVALTCFHILSENTFLKCLF